MNSFNSFGDVLNSKPRHKLYEAAAVVFGAQKIIGEGRKVIAFKDRNLIVRVNSSTAAIILKSESEELIKKINLVLGAQRIEQIKIKVGN